MAYSTQGRKSAVTYLTIVHDVQAGKIRPIYFLMGEESYYIDHLADFIADAVLRPEERAFNLLTVFGADTGVEDVMDAARGFPMGAQRQVVVVKEAQNLKNLERLEAYAKQPQTSTVLILCYKNGTLDRRKKLATLIEKVGVLYEARKLRDNELPAFIDSYMQRKGVGIAPDAVQLMADHVGADLNRMASELDKLCIALPEGKRQVDRQLVADHIGISKEFNIFELQDAIGRKDAVKVLQIASYFDKNPKAAPVPVLLTMLFRYFQNVMLAYYAPNRTAAGIAEWLGVRDWQVRMNILPPMHNYNGVKVMHILSEIRRADARSKGVDNPGTPPSEVLRELFAYILY